LQDQRNGRKGREEKKMIIILIFAMLFVSVAAFLLGQSFFAEYIEAVEWNRESLNSMLISSLLFAVSGLSFLGAVLYSISFML
jgi:hypothetical protein